MADPTIQTFCCHHRNHSDTAIHLMREFNRDSYLIITMASSTVGILGSFYQIFVRREEVGDSPRRFMGRKIIISLAYCDLFASIGLFIRSALWSLIREIMPYDDDSVSVVFCSVSSAIIQAFYTATWLWTLIYAYNMKRSLMNQPTNEKCFRYIVWSVSIVFTAIGTSSLYYPDADCHDIHDLGTALIRVMPNYVLNNGLILAVMVVNPLLYVKCSKEVDRQLIQRYGQYTNNERHIHDVFKMKFMLINLVFYICWLPNIINSVLMWMMWFNLPARVIVYIWYIIAILNPLQAFLNVLVYRKWDNQINCCSWLRNLVSRRFRGTAVNAEPSAGETSPLLRNSMFVTQSYSFSRNNLPQNSDDENFHRYSIQCPCI